MIHALMEQLSAALAEFSGTTRLYELTIGEGEQAGALLVEAFAAEDVVDEVGARDVVALSTSAYVDTASLLGQPASLGISLADGTRAAFAGDISEAALLGSDGGFARYRIRISPWLWRLDQVRNSRVWQDKSVIDIVDAVFGAYCRWRAGAGATTPRPSWPRRRRAATAANTANPTSASCAGCWRRRG
jgi:uncharacterized protein involved in type VI secretion and phage assembly